MAKPLDLLHRFVSSIRLHAADMSQSCQFVTVCIWWNVVCNKILSSSSSETLNVKINELIVIGAKMYLCKSIVYYKIHFQHQTKSTCVCVCYS